MAQVSVLKLHEANELRPLLQETIDLLDSVQTRAFELFKRRGGSPGNDVADWLQAEREVFRVPDMELAESEGEFQLQLALPGFDPKDIRVLALPQAVIVEGEAAHQHHHTTGTIHLCEFGERRAFRLIPLPKPVDADHVSATLDKGVLHIRAAKAEQNKGKSAAA
jgi:HSP20 family molecular chaperone IbpA